MPYSKCPITSISPVTGFERAHSRSGNFVVREMRMEVQRRDVFEQAQLVDVAESRERRDLLCAFYLCRTESVGIVHRNIERLHQRAGILPEALLARHEGVAVVEVFHLALL